MYVTAPSTIAEFNALLAKARLPEATPEQLAEARKSFGREKLVRALHWAPGNERARAFLVRALGLRVSGTRESAGDAGPSAADEPAPLPSEDAADTHVGAPQAKRGRERGLHVYGAKAALCFEPTTTRAGTPTVSIEAALATRPREYAWDQKLTVQATRTELPFVTAVVLGLAPECEFRNHGPDNDKGYAISHQGDKLFVRVFARDAGVRAVPVPINEAFYVAALFTRQLARAAGISRSEVPTLLRLTVAQAGGD